MKVLHILYQSLPNISGSSIRSRDILNNQLKIGIKPIVITSPFQNPSRNGVDAPAITLSMTFTETRLLTASDVAAGY